MITASGAPVAAAAAALSWLSPMVTVVPLLLWLPLSLLPADCACPMRAVNVSGGRVDGSGSASASLRGPLVAGGAQGADWERGAGCR